MRHMIPLLIVDDVQAAVDYYIHKLGFGIHTLQPKEGVPAYAVMKQNDVRVALEAKESYARRTGTELPKGLRGIGIELNMVVRDGVDGLHAELHVLGGVEIIKPIHTDEYGMRQFSIRDLNGYVLTFEQFCPNCDK